MLLCIRELVQASNENANHIEGESDSEVLQI